MNKADLPERFKLRVNVGKRDIAKGCRADAENCPVALATFRAASRLFPDQDLTVGVSQDGVSVAVVHSWDKDYPNIPDDVTEYNAKAPKALSGFVYAFDNADEVKPVAFKLDFYKWTDD